MKRQNIRSLVLVAACAFTSASLLGQTDDQLDTDVNVDGHLNLVIRDANKFDSWPEVHESIVELPSITYTLIPNKLETNYQPQPIEAAKINIEEKLKKLYRGYIKAGYGMYNTPLAELHFMDGRSRKGAYSVFARHISSSGNTALSDDIDDDYRNNHVHLWGKRFVKRHALEGYFDWTNEKYNFFGFNPEIFPDAPTTDIARITNNIGAGILLKSYYRDSSKVNYQGEVQFNGLSDNKSGVTLNEVNFIANGSGFTPDGKNLINVDFRVEYDQYDFTRRLDGEKDDFDNVLIQVDPSIETHWSDLAVNVGFRGVYNSYVNEGNFYPMVNVSYNLFDNLFIPYAGIRGELTQNSYRSLLADNPFMVTDPELLNTNNKFEIYGGLRGTLSANTSFNAKISQRKMENFIFWANDSLASPGSMLLPEYDELSISELMAEVTVNTSDRLDLYLKGQYFLYGTGNSISDIPWYQPATRFSLLAKYNIENKIIAELEMYTVGKRKAKSYVEIPDATFSDKGYYIADLKGFADFNMSFEYRYTKRLSGFVKLNNLLGGKYMLYNNYNVQRFSAMLGASYSF